jgi:hypothetical protein
MKKYVVTNIIILGNLSKNDCECNGQDFKNSLKYIDYSGIDTNYFIDYCVVDQNLMFFYQK